MLIDTLHNIQQRTVRSSCTLSRARVRVTSWPRKIRSTITGLPSLIPRSASSNPHPNPVPSPSRLTRRFLAIGSATWPLWTNVFQGITPAMREGSGPEVFAEISGALLDTAIAEQHAVTLPAAWRQMGSSPYWRFIPPSATRLRSTHSRCGPAKPAGRILRWIAAVCRRRRPTHHGAYDLSFLRCIPNMTVMARPAKTSAGNADHRFSSQRPVGCTPIRAAPGPAWRSMALTTLPSARGRGGARDQGVRGQRKKRRVAFLAFGAMVQTGRRCGRRIERHRRQHAICQTHRCRFDRTVGRHTTITL